MLDVRKLTLLREVHLRSGVTSAAHALGLTPSAVSQQIARLEEEAGTALLEPAGRGVKLTPAALRLVDHTEKVLATLEEAETELATSRAGRGGSVRVAAFHTFALTMLGETARELARIDPGLVLEFVQLDPEDAIEELSARRVDLVIADEYPGLPLKPVPGLVRHELGTDPIRTYLPAGSASPEHAQRGIWHAADLQRVPWVMEPRGSASFQWALGVCRAAGFEPLVRFESPDPPIHQRLVEEGVAAAFIPGTLTADIPSSPGPVPGISSQLSRTLFTLVRRGTERSPAITACRTAVSHALTPVLPSLRFATDAAVAKDHP